MKNNKIKLSIALATYNEESNIKKFLENFSDIGDEIIIVDGQSSDNTVKIAQKYPKVKIISTTNKPMFHLNKQMAIDACQGDWILQMDADELLTPQLKKEIKSIVGQNPEKIEYNGFWIKRKNFFLGSFLKKGGVYPDPTIRLYKNGKGHLPCQDVHEQAHIDGKIGWLKHDMEHYADPSFSRYLLRANRYTTLLAQQLKEQKVPLNFSSFFKYYFLLPNWWFFKTFFRHRGFMDGLRGFVFSYFSALRFPIAYTKYYELKQNITQGWA
jgi:glycosyltransferase involved in cell wall biosynthesis